MTTIRQTVTDTINEVATTEHPYITNDHTYASIRDRVVSRLTEWVEGAVSEAVEQARSLGYEEEAAGILRSVGLMDPEPEPEPVVAEEAPSTLDAILDAVNEVKAKVETDLSELVRRVGALETAAVNNGIRLG